MCPLRLISLAVARVSRSTGAGPPQVLWPLVTERQDARLEAWAAGAHTALFHRTRRTFARTKPSGLSTGATRWAPCNGTATRSPGRTAGSGIIIHRFPPGGTVDSRDALGDLASDTAANAPVSLFSPRVRRLHRFFEATSDRAPDNIAVEDGDHRVSYRELDQQANQLAHMLRGLNIETGTRVGILLHRSLQTYVSLLAILKAGAAFVPIDPGSPRDRIAYVIDDSGLDLVITSTQFAAVTADVGRLRLELDRLGEALATYPASRVADNGGDGDDGDALCYVAIPRVPAVDQRVLRSRSRASATSSTWCPACMTCGTATASTRA